MLDKQDIQNLISIVNKVSFVGAEAETVASLKQKLVQMSQSKDGE